MKFALKSLTINPPRLTARVAAIMDGGESEIIYRRKIDLRYDASLDEAIAKLMEELNPSFVRLHQGFRNLVVEQPSLFENFTEYGREDPESKPEPGLGLPN